MQLVSAPPPGAFLDTWAPPRAGRRRENQLRELILYSTLCYSTLSSAPSGAPGELWRSWRALEVVVVAAAAIVAVFLLPLLLMVVVVESGPVILGPRKTRVGRKGGIAKGRIENQLT